MNIKDMFDKPIDRDIQGVIKVGQDSQENVTQELEEYVVTDELFKHFKTFFASYKNGINSHTDKMGVWITGFFGSGKSHLLKILSYILQNKEVNGKRALEYFTDGKKISDNFVVGDMKLAGQVPTDVILFNIDSKSEADSKERPDAIVGVFLKVFNEMQGYCGTLPHIADLERFLDSKGKYQLFKETFEKINGSTWVESREDDMFISDDVVKTLVETQIMSEETARKWVDKAESEFHISIEGFAKLVKDYCDKKGNNHHVVFFVDEVGQYIADNTRLMLNLQTVTEDLGTACGGRAWIVVTSQQDIDSVVHVEGQDFSKIQGRFETRLNLSSSNVGEVIRKRILAKTPDATNLLKTIYTAKEPVLKNLITFSDAVYKELYADAEDFADVYPFIPYQFNLLGEVLTSIRKHSASGKHLAEGERSMIALFKESAMSIEHKTEGVLVPFNKFYDALAKFIDHTNSTVINHAEKNPLLNNPFDTEVLKVLFMIKYVKEIKCTVENLTTLMVSHIDDDRVELRKKVEEALSNLVKQTLVQKNGDEYVFLTDEEQEINRAINDEIVDVGDVVATAKNMVFSSILRTSKYSYSNRYVFPFNQKVDDYNRDQSEAIGIHIITPYYNGEKGDGAMRMMSASGDAIFRLSEDSTFLEEIREQMKLENYLRKNATELSQTHEVIHQMKSKELAEKGKRIIVLLEKAISDADVYINGDKYDCKAADAEEKIKEALRKEVENIYFKLSYMTTQPNYNSIVQLFTTDATLGLDMTDNSNKLALDDVYKYVYDNSLSNNRITFKSVLQHFIDNPYGFTELDIGFLVAKLFKENKIALSITNKAISVLENSADEIAGYVTKREYQDKLIVENKKHISEAQLKRLRDVMNEVFNKSVNTEDDEKTAADFRDAAGKELKEIESYLYEYNFASYLPGKDILETGRALMSKICAFTMYTQLYDYIDKSYDDLLEYADDSRNVLVFHKGEQKNIFKKGWDLKNLYDNSKNYIDDDILSNNVSIINNILQQKNPWTSIPQLKLSNDAFEAQYSKLLSKAKEDQKKLIAADFNSVTEYLAQSNLTDTFGVKAKFDDIQSRLDSSNDIAKVNGFVSESNTVKANLIGIIAASLVKTDSGTSEEPAKHAKNVYLKTVVTNTVVQINTEADADNLAAQIAASLKAQLKNNPGGLTVLL